MSQQESYHKIEFSIVDGGPLDKGLKRVGLTKSGANFLGIRLAAIRGNPLLVAANRYDLGLAYIGTRGAGRRFIGAYRTLEARRDGGFAR